jgi:hypothetical protein
MLSTSRGSSMLTFEQIQKHYKTKAIKDTIIRIATDGEYSRAGMKCTPNAFRDRKTGELIDSMDWYRGSGKYWDRKFLKKIDLSEGKDGLTANICRTLYWTLNVFEKGIYDIDYKTVQKGDGPIISRNHTVGYTLGVDIDREHGMDIHDPEVKKAVEDMAQFYSNKLREHAPNSIYCLYSGGGIYVMVHHRVFDRYFETYRSREDWNVKLLTLTDSFDALIGDIRDEFFKIHPEHKGKVKPDQLNGSQRVFKTIFSIHKSLDYAVIPLAPKNIKIDFESATLPLKPEVIESGKNWYSQFDSDAEFLNVVLMPYFEKASEKKKYTYKVNSGKTHTHTEPSDIEKADTPIYDLEKWPPCMRNLYNLPSCGEGATRALAILASFLYQMGIPEDDAVIFFDDVADRWGARKSNLFESYFGHMNVPTCQRLISNDNRGFPKGVSIKSLNVCKPDIKCMNVPSPRYYADTESNIKLLLKPRSEKPKTKNESKEVMPVF